MNIKNPADDIFICRIFYFQFTCPSYDYTIKTKGGYQTYE